MVEEEEEVIAAEEQTVEEKDKGICSFIPTDVYELEIMLYLPAKKLQSLKTVCKDWLQLITSSYFVRLHLSRGIQSRIRVLMRNFPFPAILEYNNYYKDTKHLIHYPPQFSRCTKILGSADGLAYLFDRSSSGYITGVFNPSTGKCFVVQLSPCPPTSQHIIFYWFGNLSGGECVLVAGLLSTGPHYETCVYKFTRNSKIMNRICSTQLIVQAAMKHLDEKGTFVQEVVYWPVRFGHRHPRRYKILAYQLGKNKHMEILPPAQCDFRLGLFVDGCSLFATFKKIFVSVVELWIMKQDCWIKHANIEGSNNLRILSPLGFFPNGDLVMDADKSRLVKYSFSQKETTPLMVYGMHMQEVVMCADGLVSPGC